MHGLVTRYEEHGRSVLATLIVRESAFGPAKTVKIYDASTMTKNEFLEELTRDIREMGCTSYETVDVKILQNQVYRFVDAN